MEETIDLTSSWVSKPPEGLGMGESHNDPIDPTISDGNEDGPDGSEGDGQEDDEEDEFDEEMIFLDYGPAVTELPDESELACIPDLSREIQMRELGISINSRRKAGACHVGMASAYIDQDDSGDYNPKAYERSHRPAARTTRVKVAQEVDENASRNVKPFRHPIDYSFDMTSTLAKQKSLNYLGSITPGPEDAEFGSDGAGSSDSRDSDSCVSETPKDCTKTRRRIERANITDERGDGLTLEGLTYDCPQRRGCKSCFHAGDNECSLIEFPYHYPCDSCQDGDFDCELIIPPKFKKSCLNCKRKRQSCSYVRDGGKGSDRCDACEKEDEGCCAPPLKPDSVYAKRFSNIRTPPPLEPDSVYVKRFSNIRTPSPPPGPPPMVRIYAACNDCLATGARCSLKINEDGPCSRCRALGQECKFVLPPKHYEPLFIQPQQPAKVVKKVSDKGKSTAIDRHQHHTSSLKNYKAGTQLPKQEIGNSVDQSISKLLDLPGNSGGSKLSDKQTSGLKKLTKTRCYPKVSKHYDFKECFGKSRHERSQEAYRVLKDRRAEGKDVPAPKDHVIPTQEKIRPARRLKESERPRNKTSGKGEHQLISRTRGIKHKIIKTCFAHPIMFNHIPEPPDNHQCSWCASPFFGLWGLGEVEVEVIPYGGYRGNKEIKGGHFAANGKGSSKMCVRCTFSRLRIVVCEGHKIEDMKKIDRRSFNPQLLIDSFKALSLGDKVNGRLALKTKWCHICVAIAEYKCCSPQHEDQDGYPATANTPPGCGLNLCKKCNITLKRIAKPQSRWQKVDYIKTLVDLRKEELYKYNLSGTAEGDCWMRADVGFLMNDGEIMEILSQGA